MIPHPEDTIVALSSAPGPGRRAIVRLSGPNAVAVVNALFTSTIDRQITDSPRHLTPGHLQLSNVHSPLPADAYFFRGPHSYTGQDLIELHTISSPPLVERLIADLLAAGARSAQPGEFTLRAFLSGKKDLTRAEAVLDVIEAGSDAELKQALTQLAGGVARPMDALRDDLLSLLADVEAGLDFVEEDIEFVGKPEQLKRIAAGLAQLTDLKRQLDARTVSGRPIRVALVGEPNAGKSSLFNALVGSAGVALVSPTAGTTRDYLTQRLDLDGVPVELIDTAGWQDSTDTIEGQAQRLGREQTEQADLVLWCVPAGEEVLDSPPNLSGAEVLRVHTKADLLPPPLRGRVGGENQPAVAASVVSPDGTLALRERLADKVQALSRSSTAPSQSRCRHHVEAAIDSLQRAHGHVFHDDPQELLALELRKALDQIGEMVGAVYTNDLLDRIFSRFCIGK
ncbi:tRNA uridine-5-carboxymethylaminomethyl(34) synthesis GTPase MnmE [Limnoglobus roseus]|uniref:tRNA modification GTPase MnmE n=1 Tax=Limnoglobus roseus TaxID=2598579 RepID=A0A5C1A5L7_9BACT|nr:tRNA uridine-5-carboxymethylaminomethyl(34) synthesis GTPase MnmE [Limnoglobus roseus]QEL14361.1 GTP-binding protein [Limnoglobus roseus]